MLTFGWLTLYTVLVARAGEVLRRPGVRRMIEAATGTILLGLGLRIALELPAPTVVRATAV